MIIFDFRTKDNNHKNVKINDEIVERIEKYNYLGVTFDENISWQKHTYKAQTILNQRMYFVRKLSYLNIDSKLITLFYRSCVISILTFCVCIWRKLFLKKKTPLLKY